jgi:hypothetical protein
MEKPWWEDSVCWICNWWWIVLLGLVALGVGMYMLWPRQTNAASVQLIWANTNDLDLKVIAPDGKWVSPSRPYTFPGVKFFKDINADCVENITTTPLEEVAWNPKDLAAGNYVIQVYYQRACQSESATDFTVQIKMPNAKLVEFTGALQVGEKWQQVIHYQQP